MKDEKLESLVKQAIEKTIAHLETAESRIEHTVYSDDKIIVAAADENIKMPYPHLKLYDEVIISGKDLSDGMVIG